MKPMRWMSLSGLACVIALVSGCERKAPEVVPASQPVPVYFHVDPAAAGSIKGSVHFAGKRPHPAVIDMSGDPACVEAHGGKAYDESLVVDPKGALANAFVYIKQGLEGKNFEVPAVAVTIDQKGCWFRPRIMGIQVGQMLQVVN